MKVTLKEEHSTPNPDDVAILAARGDYMEDSLVDISVEEAMAGTEKSRDELIRDLLRKGHFGPFEHNTAYFAIEGISRVTMSQITRHRHLSFDVQSMRYVDFEDAGMVTPPSFDDADMEIWLHPDGYVKYDPESEYSSGEGKEITRWVMYQQTRLYQQLVESGVPEEDARFVLPLGTKVNMSMSGNARTLMHLFDLRHSGKAQWEVRELAAKMIEECEDWAPLTFQSYEKHIKNNSLRAP